MKAKVPRNNSDCTLFFLGTSSGGPTISRNCSSAVLHWDSKVLLFDCGEGTLRQFLYLGSSPAQVNHIFITHLHGDHIFGLPSMLLHLNVAHSAHNISAKLEGSKVPPPGAIHIFGPEGIYNYVASSMKMSRAVLKTKIVIHELIFPDLSEELDVNGRPLSNFKRARERDFKGATQPLREMKNALLLREAIPCLSGTWELPDFTKSQRGRVQMKAVRVAHTAPTVGFVLEEEDFPGAVDAKKASALGLHPGPLYKDLKEGHDVTLDDGRVVRSADVVGAAVKGRKIVLLGDTCNPGKAAQLAAVDADLLVHEATVEEDDIRARHVGHSTPRMAGAFARATGAARLALTHFSARMDRGFFSPRTVHVDWSAPGPPLLYVVDPDTGRSKDVGSDNSTASKNLIRRASEAFGSTSVLTATDFMALPVPRGGFTK